MKHVKIYEMIKEEVDKQKLEERLNILLNSYLEECSVAVDDYDYQTTINAFTVKKVIFSENISELVRDIIKAYE